jgi:RimJ/RimL family protein N-acetyltransferase
MAALVLEQLTTADVAPILEWISGPDELVQWAGPALFAWPLTLAQLESYVAGASAAGRRVFRPVPAGARGGDEQTGLLGLCELGESSTRHRSAKVCRVLVAPSHRGEGVGRAMVSLLADIAFGEHEVHRLHLNVYSFNEAAIRCYQAAGFRREGLLRDTTLTTGGFWDTVVMAMLEDEWRSRR